MSRPDSPDPILRLFLAADVGPEIRSVINRWAIQARSVLTPEANRSIRWVPPENLHITLKFLGDTPGKNVDQITQIVSPIIRRHTRSECHVTSAGTFGPRQLPSVIYLNISDGGILSIMAGELDAALEIIGYKREQQLYVPHITLGRARMPKNARLAMSVIKQHPVDIQFRPQSVTLFQSTFTHSSSIHVPLQVFDMSETLREME